MEHVGGMTDAPSRLGSHIILSEALENGRDSGWKETSSLNKYVGDHWTIHNEL